MNITEKKLPLAILLIGVVWCYLGHKPHFSLLLIIVFKHLFSDEWELNFSIANLHNCVISNFLYIECDILLEHIFYLVLINAI